MEKTLRAERLKNKPAILALTTLVLLGACSSEPEQPKPKTAVAVSPTLDCLEPIAVPLAPGNQMVISTEKYEKPGNPIDLYLMKNNGDHVVIQHGTTTVPGSTVPEETADRTINLVNGSGGVLGMTEEDRSTMHFSSDFLDRELGLVNVIAKSCRTQN